MSNRTRRRAARRTEARRRQREAGQEDQSTEERSESDRAEAPAQGAPQGGFLRRAFPPAPPLPGKPDPLAGFGYSGRGRRIVEHLWLLIRNPLAWIGPAGIWAFAQFATITGEGAAWHVFLHFRVRDVATQQAFIDAYRPVVDEHVTGWPGFLGATLYASSDGTRVINHTRWVDEAAYQHYLDVSDGDARLRAIQAAFDRVPEVAGPEMTLTHTYRPVVAIPG
jgi:C-6 monooxygenase